MIPLAITAIATSVIGTGVSVYGQMAAARTSEKLAAYNANVQARNASQEMRLALAQADLNKRSLEMQAAAQESAARVAFQNAKAMRSDADTQAGIDRAEREKSRKEHLRLMATQRAKIAGSGMAESGSPLALLAETAGLVQLDLEEQHYAADLERRSRLREADLMEYSGRQGLFEAGMSRFNTKFEDLRALGARAAYANAKTGIRLGRMAAAADASNMRIGAAGSLLSGISNTAYMGFTMKNELPKAR